MFVADLHNDVLQRAIIGQDIITHSNQGHTDIDRLILSGINLEVFVIWVTKKHLQLNPFKRANELINKLEEIEKKTNKIKKIKSLEDLNFAINKSIISAPFGIEGGECLEENIDNLIHFIDRGLLYFGPTWNYSNSIATSAYDETYNSNRFDKIGLSEFGKKIIKICDENKIIIDVSHIGEKSFYDIIDLSYNPIIASHSCVYEICNHYRNLKDEQIIAIKKTNGAVFVNLYPLFIDNNFKKHVNKINKNYIKELNEINLNYPDSDENWIYKQIFLQKKLNYGAPKLSRFIDHIEYIINLVGAEHVGIGSDYDGIDCLPKEMIDCTNHMLIADELKTRGFSNSDIEKIMGLNFLRIFQEIKSK
mgnify:CR=1 FL=1